MHKQSNQNRITAALPRLALAAGIALASAAAHAQSGTSGALEEIVVTAEKREASLQDTAISISAFSAEQLREGGIQTSEQLTGFTPGLVIQRDVIGKVVIRGVGTENFTIAGDPGVAISADGAYLARSSTSIFDLFDLERVEVLRGPQGTLYGRNATGGAINFISNRPTEEFEAFFQGDFGEFSKTRLEAAISGPISDRLLGRFSALVHKRDGYTDNVFPDVGRGLDELDDKDLFAARGQLTWLAADNVTVNLKADIYRDDSNPPPYKYTDDPLIFLGGVPFPNPLGSDLRTVSQGFEFRIPGSERSIDDAGRWDQSGFLATVDWDISDTLAFRSLTSYRDVDFEWLNDGDGLAAFLVTYFQVDTSDQFSQEFQLSSSNDGPLNWIVGTYFLKEEGESFIGIPLPLGFDLPLSVLIDGESETTAYALFGEMSYDFTDQLRLNLGGRYSYEEKDVFYIDDRSSLGGAAVTVNDSDSWNSFTPKVGLDYFVNDDVMLYGSITRGFKSGGFNLLAVQPSYDEEEITSFEVGAKSRLADGRVQLNASLFHYDYDDLQVGKVVNLSATIQNAAAATIYGSEVELRALLTDNFQIDWGVSFLNTEYDDFETQDPGTPGAPVISLAGNELPRAPDVTSSLSGRYTWPVNNGGSVELWGNWQFTGEQYFTQFNRDNVRQKAYNVWNARLTYRSPDDRWSVALYGDNILDEDYLTNTLESGVPTPGVDPVAPQSFLAAPRVWGVTFRYNLGF